MSDEELREHLKCAFNYNKHTGEFTWKIKSGAVDRRGKIAGKTDSHGYVQLSYKSKAYLAHRVAWLFEHGYWPKQQIDHVDRDKKNNSIDNLRDVSHNMNQHNRVTPLSSGTSGYLGVSFHRSTGKFQASITLNGKQKYIGVFTTPEEAHAAYLAAKRELHEGCTI